MDKRLAEILLLVMFGISLSASTTNAFMAIFPFGVGHVVIERVSVFLIRASFMAIMVMLSSLGLILALRFCNKVEPKGVILDFINVVTILVLATIPWLCDHITRFLFLPFNNVVTIREEGFKGVDIIFVVMYLVLIATLYLIRYLWIIIINRK